MSYLSHISLFRSLWKPFVCVSNIKWGIHWWERKRIHALCADGIEKFVPHDHRLSSLGKPRDANRWSWGRIFQSHSHIHDESYCLKLPWQPVVQCSNVVKQDICETPMCIRFVSPENFPFPSADIKHSLVVLNCHYYIPNKCLVVASAIPAWSRTFV